MIQELPSSRSAAKSAGTRHYFTGKPCKHGHIEKRLASTGGCLGCHRAIEAGKRASSEEYRRYQAAYKSAWGKSERGRALAQASKERRRDSIRARDRAATAEGRYTARRRAHYHAVLKNRPQHKIAHNVRCRIARALKTGSNALPSRIRVLCGYTIDELMVHLERQFLRGMNWQNYGPRGWHIDHIVPMRCFNLEDAEDFKACWSLSNLRPLWWRDNLQKSANVHFLT